MSLSPSFPAAWGFERRARLGANAGRAALAILLVLSVVLAIALRLGPALDKPMWLDEAWTGMMAQQRSVPDLVHQIRDDANAPLYYGLIWIWAKAVGLSNVALRAPNLLIGLAGAGVATLQRRTLGVRPAIVWGLLLLFWWPALDLAFSARCYTLLILLSTATTAAFIHLMRRPSVSAASIWAAAAALMVLTHYDAALLVLSQAGLLLLVHRTRTVKLWPAALIFLPAFAWGLYHLPRLQQFARTNVAWYPLLTASDLSDILFFCCGGPLAVAVAIGLAGFALTSGQGRPKRWTPPRLSPATWSVLASLLAAALMFGVGTLRPSMTVRYFTPFAPGVLLGLSLLAESAAKRVPLAAAVLPVVFMVTAAGLTHAETPFGFETASLFVQEGSPTRLEFFWDHPATQVEAADQLRQVGDFFFSRGGRPVQVDPVYVRPGQDPNTVMAARGGRGSAIIWLYYHHLKGVAAQSHPPAALLRDPRWRCRNFGSAMGGVLACRPA